MVSAPATTAPSGVRTSRPDTPGGYASDYRDQGCDQAARGPDPGSGERGGDHDRLRSRHSGHRQGEAQEGEVVAIGPGRVDDNGNRVPLDVSVGDKVIYSKYGGTEVKYAGDEFLILSARDVLAVVS